MLRVGAGAGVLVPGAARILFLMCVACSGEQSVLVQQYMHKGSFRSSELIASRFLRLSFSLLGVRVSYSCCATNTSGRFEGCVFSQLLRRAGGSFCRNTKKQKKKVRLFVALLYTRYEAVGCFAVKGRRRRAVRACKTCHELRGVRLMRWLIDLRKYISTTVVQPMWGAGRSTLNSQISRGKAEFSKIEVRVGGTACFQVAVQPRSKNYKCRQANN